MSLFLQCISDEEMSYKGHINLDLVELKNFITEPKTEELYYNEATKENPSIAFYDWFEYLSNHDKEHYHGKIFKNKENSHDYKFKSKKFLKVVLTFFKRSPPLQIFRTKIKWWMNFEVFAQKFAWLNFICYN